MRMSDWSSDVCSSDLTEEEVSGDEERGASILPGLLAELLRPPDRDSPTGYLRSASIIDGTLIFSDGRSGLIWRAPDADITLSRHPRGISGDNTVERRVGKGGVKTCRPRGSPEK